MADLPHWLADYIGIPWVKKGKDISGADCWGLLSLIYIKEFGVDISPLEACYDDTRVGSTEVHGVLTEKKANWISIKADEIKLGDVILFYVGGMIAHVGMVINNYQFIHVLESTQSAIEKINGIRWKSRIEGFYRCPLV